MKRQNLRIIEIEEGEETQVKDREIIFNKNRKRQFSYPKKRYIYKYFKKHQIDKKILIAHNKTITG